MRTRVLRWVLGALLLLPTYRALAATTAACRQMSSMACLNGRSGGQEIAGGSASGESLTLDSNSADPNTGSISCTAPQITLTGNQAGSAVLIPLNSVLQFEDQSNTYTLSFKTQTQTENSSYFLPTARPTSDGQVLLGDTAGVMSWADPIVSQSNPALLNATVTQGPAAAASGAWPVKVTDGTSVEAVKAAQVVPTLLDPAGVVAISPNNTGLPVNVPSVVNGQGNVTASGTTVAVTFTPAAGNTFVVMCGINNTGTISVSDDKSNAYVTAKSQTGTIAGALISYALTVQPGSTTITCTAGTSGVVTIRAYEVNGLLAFQSAQPGVTDSNTASSQTSAVLSAGLAPVVPNEMVFTAVMLTTNNAGTAGSGWTIDGQQGATGGRLLPARRVMPTLSNLTSANTVATFSSASYALAAATFRPVILGVQGTCELTDGVTKVSVTTAGALKEDVFSIAGTATDVNSGNKSNGTQRVVLATDQPTMSNAQPITDTNLDNATLVDNAGFTDGTTRVMMEGHIFDETAGTALTENDAAASRVDSKRAQVMVIEDETTRGTRQTVKAASTPAATTDKAAVVAPIPIAAPICTSFIAISQTATTKVVSGSSGKKVYICAITIVANAAEVVSITEGTGTTCATGQTAIYGSTTAANGMSFAANGGFAQASPTPFVVTSTNTDDLCVVQSGSSRVTGSISYVLQ